MDILRKLFASYAGVDAVSAELLPQSGGRRRYYRMTAPGVSLIGVIGTDILEDKAFCYMADHFRDAGIRVPEVYSVSEDGLHYIQQDLGSVSLFNAIASGRTEGYSSYQVDLLRKTVSALPEIQLNGCRGFDYSVCHPCHEFQARQVMFDLEYFKYCYLKVSGAEFDPDRLQDDFDALCSDLLSCDDIPCGFLYRDFQSRNVMVFEDEPYFIDFQGGYKGPVYYDIASFIWQARARYPRYLKERMLDWYIEALRKYADFDETVFRGNFRKFVLFRTLQILGAYGFRGLIEGKTLFIESIPYGLDSLRELLETPFDSYPYLNSILQRIVLDRPFSLGEVPSDGKLTVDVYSFSYRRGIPKDTSSNGGGFVFDCRGMQNPGRYEQYKHLTGRDEPVKAFLEEKGEIKPFLEHIYDIVDPHVDCFLERGFTRMMVCFGCTGGQHRSVFSADSMARHLREKYGSRVRVRLAHREQNIIETE